MLVTCQVDVNAAVADDAAVAVEDAVVVDDAAAQAIDQGDSSNL